MKPWRVSLFCALILITGCRAALPISENPASTIQTGYDIGELSGQKLSSGQCGLFLFTPLPTARFVFFARWEEYEALIRLNGEDIQLSGPIPLEEGVDTSHQIRRAFTSKRGKIQIEIAITPLGNDLKDGARIRSGLIRIRGEGGWTQLVPVAGAFACSSE